MNLRRAPIEQRIAARQRERGPMKQGKYFDHGPAALVFGFVLAFVALTHVIALVVLLLE